MSHGPHPPGHHGPGPSGPGHDDPVGGAEPMLALYPSPQLYKTYTNPRYNIEIRYPEHWLSNQTNTDADPNRTEIVRFDQILQILQINSLIYLYHTLPYL